MWEVREGDCVQLMRAMEPASVDAVVCDPPYGLEFMGKDWDRLDRIGFHRGEPQTFTEGGSVPLPPTPSFNQGRGKRCDDCGKYAGGNPKINCTCESPRFRNVHRGAEQEEWHRRWCEQAFRVLKPGGHLLAFGGTRTYHRLACAVEDAGFEIRDTISWLYGSGFPKSLDVSKAIDKAAGVERGRTERPAFGGAFSDDGGTTYGTVLDSEPITPKAEQWEGWGTALKPAHEPVVVARKPLAGTVAGNVLGYGTGALNIDGTRIGPRDRTKYGLQDATRSRGATYGKPSASADFDSSAGRWPANVVLSHLPECTVETRTQTNGTAETATPGTPGQGPSLSRCVPDCPVRLLDEQTGELPPAQSRTAGQRDRDPGWGMGPDTGVVYGDSGGASRFFYVAKASRGERNAGLDGFEEQFSPTMGNGIGGKEHDPDTATPKANVHPTVKPIELMRWLVRLVTPPGGTVLDPFTGSGTTGCAAALEGVDFLGLEREPEYVQIARARVAWWEKHRGEGTADRILAAGGERDRLEAEGQLGMFDVPPPVDRAAREGEASAERRYTDRGGSNFAMKPGRRRLTLADEH